LLSKLRVTWSARSVRVSLGLVLVVALAGCGTVSGVVSPVASVATAQGGRIAAQGTDVVTQTGVVACPWPGTVDITIFHNAIDVSHCPNWEDQKADSSGHYSLVLGTGKYAILGYAFFKSGDGTEFVFGTSTNGIDVGPGSNWVCNFTITELGSSSWSCTNTAHGG
jgi:hypothetical protein